MTDRTTRLHRPVHRPDDAFTLAPSLVCGDCGALILEGDTGTAGCPGRSGHVRAGVEATECWECGGPFDDGPCPGKEPQETIVAAAVEHACGLVLSLPRPARHHHIVKRMADLDIYRLNEARHEQGFLTSRGRFVTREEAFTIADAAGQIIKKTHGLGLFSEDVW